MIGSGRVLQIPAAALDVGAQVVLAGLVAGGREMEVLDFFADGGGARDAG